MQKMTCRFVTITVLLYGEWLVIIITNTFIKEKSMPKIIDNLREQIQKEAMRQILTDGYSKTTIRSVAKGCNIAVGTMYNYFNSKDELISSFMLEDWRICVGKMTSIETDDPELFLRQLQNALETFIKKYETLFNDEDAQRVFATVLFQRHIQFRARIAGLLVCVLQNTDYEDKQFLSEYIAESIINWTMAKVPFDKQYSIIKKLI